MKTFFVSVLLAIAMCSVVSADQFMNITFNSDTAGLPPTTGAMGAPITQIGGIGGYGPFNMPPTAANGTIIVSDVAGMNNAAVMTTNSSNGTIGALFMDTGFSWDARIYNISFDIGILAAPTTAISQGGYHLDGSVDTYGILFGARAYEHTTDTWAFSFSVVPTSENSGVFALRNKDNNELTSFGNYIEGQSYNIALLTNYNTGTVSAYVDGVLGYSGYPTRSGPISTSVTTNTTELFLYLNGESGYSNQVAIDNIKASVPEPSSIILLATGVLSMLTAVRRRK